MHTEGHERQHEPSPDHAEVTSRILCSAPQVLSTTADLFLALLPFLATLGRLPRQLTPKPSHAKAKHPKPPSQQGKRP
jgi:hypothetical protein